MKKILLGTTAIAAVALAATTASAQTLEQRIQTLEETMLMGSPGTGFDVDVSGYIHSGFFLVDADPTAPSRTFYPADHADVDMRGKVENTTETDYAGTDVKLGDAEIQLGVSSQLDNGITIGGRIEVEGHTTGDQIDETYIYAQGGFGRVIIGAEDGSAAQTHIGGPALPLNGVNAPSYRSTPSGSNGVRTGTGIEISGDANKITYFTPRFSGFQFGISYAPDNENRDGQGGGGGVTDRNAGNSHIENIVDVSGNFNRDLGDFAFGVSAGWESGAATDDRAEDPSNWNIGGSVTAQGFTIGGSYYRADGFTGGDGKSYLSGDGTTDLSDKLEQTAWTVGATYNTGPWTFGVGYFQGEGGNYAQALTFSAGDADNNEGTPLTWAAEGEPETRTIGIGASYEVGDGVNLGLDVQFYEDDADLHADHPDAKYSKVEATAAGLILGISF